MSEGAVFLTGATGSLGPWIAQRCLSEGRALRVLARAAEGQSARQRVERSIAVAATHLETKRIEVIEGDILDEQIDPGRIDLIVHCAACTAFDDRSANDSYRTNVLGLQRILNLAEKQKIPVVHVSTAYVCGNREGCVLESEREVGQTFNNVYEQSKCAGEALVHKWSAQTGLPAIILRPSIVLGDSQTGRAARFNTLYHLMRALDAAGGSRKFHRLRLVARAEVTKNVIPVDVFAEIAWRIICRGLPGTYHISHPHPITIGELRDIFSELFEIDLALVTAQDLGGASAIERVCGRVMAPYRSYMVKPEPHFDQRATVGVVGAEICDIPKLGSSYFRRLLEYARAAKWGARIPEATVSRNSIDPVTEYFEVFLSQRTHQNLLPDLKRLSARVNISMKDQPGSCWWLDLREGVLQSITREPTTSDCSFSLNAATFLEIAAGRLPPQRAFFTGRVRLTGNMELGLKVATVLARFFTEHPFVPNRNDTHASTSNTSDRSH